MTGQIFIWLCIFIQAIAANKDDFEERRLYNITQTLAHSEVETLTYGVYLKKVDMIDLAASTWTHIFRVPRLPPPPTRQLRKICEAIPHVEEVLTFFQKTMDSHDVPHYVFDQDVFNRTRHIFCSSLEQLGSTYGTLLNYTQERNADLFLNMISLITNRIDQDNHFPVVNWTSPDEPIEDIYLDLDHKNGTIMRRKRGLFNLFGKVGKLLFGLSTEDDVDTLQADVKTLELNHVNLRHHFRAFQNEMRSVLDVHWDRMDLITSVVNKTLKHVLALQELHMNQRITIKINQVMVAIYFHALMEVISELTITHQALQEYQSIMRDHTLGMVRINEQYLSPEMVSVQDLEKALGHIQTILQEHYVPFRFAFNSLNYFYTVPVTSYVSDTNYLYIQVKIPLTVLNSNYHVYEVFSVPLPASESGKHFTQITNLPSYVGYSSHGDTYATFSGRFLRTCLGQHVKRCPHRVAEVSTTEPSCILGLFLKDDQMINNYCTTDLVITASLSEQILDIGRGKYFLSASPSDDNWVIHCPGQRPRMTKPCSSCIVTLGCRCSLKTKAAFISASLVNCNSKTETTGIHRSYIPNLIWISQLKEFSGFSQAVYNITTELTHDPIPNLPALPLPSYEEVKEFADRNSMIKTSLSRIMQAAKANEPLYVTKLQEVTSRIVHSKLSLYLNVLCILWLIGLSVLAFFGGRYILYVLTLTSKFAVTEASPIGPEPQTTNIPYAYQVFICYMVTALTLYITGHSIYLLWKWYLKHKERQRYFPLTDSDKILTIIYLQLTTPFRLATLFVDELCVPAEYLQLEKQPHDSLIVKHKQTAWTNSLLLTWSSINLRHMDGINIPLPEEVKVPRHLSHLVSTILADPDVRVHLLLKTGPYVHEHSIKIRRPNPTPAQKRALTFMNRECTLTAMDESKKVKLTIPPPPKSAESMKENTFNTRYLEPNAHPYTEIFDDGKHAKFTQTPPKKPPRLTSWYSMTDLPQLEHDEFKQDRDTLLAQAGSPVQENPKRPYPTPRPNGPVRTFIRSLSTAV